MFILCIKLCYFSHVHCILSSTSILRNTFQLPPFFSSSVRRLTAILFHIDILYNSWACNCLFQMKCSCFLVLNWDLGINSLLFQWMSRFQWLIFYTQLKILRRYLNFCTCLKLTSPIRSLNIGIIFNSWPNAYTIKETLGLKIKKITFKLSLVKIIFQVELILLTSYFDSSLPWKMKSLEEYSTSGLGVVFISTTNTLWCIETSPLQNI